MNVMNGAASGGRERTILLCDLNNFYASVECFLHPEIRHLPVVVGGSEEARHGIVLAKNQIAKGYGIKTGEPLVSARQKCPGLLSVKPNFDNYLKFSRLTREIYMRYTDLVESFSIDEAFLDVTDSCGLFGDGKTIADDIRATVKRELGVTVSAGVSFNKVFAKLAAELKKPDGTSVISRDNYKEVAWRLPASDLLYVGPATTAKLEKYGITTIGQLARMDTSLLSRRLGVWGGTLSRYANGLDDAPVAQKGEEAIIKSVGNSSTLPRDVTTVDEVKKVFYMLSESVAARLREHELKATTIQIYMRDNKLQTEERQGRLAYPTFLSAELAERALEVFNQKYQMKLPIRSLGVRGCNLVPADTAVQLDLYTNQANRERQETLEYAIDDLRRRFGYGVVQRGILYEDTKLTKVNPGSHVIHPIAFSSGARLVSDPDYKLKGA